ncbi:hypothetical protein HanIR_Chr09g0428241 [Helianthus annuus]|nr:hypothetical protein HanIR_Chr09g0428241 [Helianthus annuus]
MGLYWSWYVFVYYLKKITYIYRIFFKSRAPRNHGPCVEILPAHHHSHPCVSICVEWVSVAFCIII